MKTSHTELAVAKHSWLHGLLSRANTRCTAWLCSPCEGPVSSPRFPPPLSHEGARSLGLTHGLAQVP